MSFCILSTFTFDTLKYCNFDLSRIFLANTYKILYTFFFFLLSSKFVATCFSVCATKQNGNH